MQPIPVKVKNVTVYAYFNPEEPLTEVILTGCTGTYSVGTLLTSSFYNLDIDKIGKKVNPLTIHGRYYATGETMDGQPFSTPWMFCTNDSKQPDFGRTIRHLSTIDGDVDMGLPHADESGFIKVGPLTDINVSQLFPPPAIGQRQLISNGKGFIIATKTGTPHEMGVQVDTGTRYGQLIAGSKRVIISGRTKNGEPFSQTGYTIISGGKPAIFLKVWPH